MFDAAESPIKEAATEPASHLFVSLFRLAENWMRRPAYGHEYEIILYYVSTITEL